MTFVLALSFLPYAALAKSEKTEIDLGDRVVRGLIDHPNGQGPFPFLVIAVGDDADLNHRLYSKLVAGAVNEGFVTLRLDWSYKKSKPAVAADLKREAEELGIIITELTGSRMMKQYEIDPSKVALVAKGYGAKVAMVPESGALGEKVKAILFLNPVCESATGSFTSLYAGFLAAKIPRMIAATRGGGCPLSQIHAAAKDLGDDGALLTGDGDALFTFGKGNANQDLVIAASVNWLRNRGWAPPKISTPKKPNAKKHDHEGHSAGTHP